MNFDRNYKHVIFVGYNQISYTMLIVLFTMFTKWHDTSWYFDKNIFVVLLHRKVYDADIFWKSYTKDQKL